MRKISLVIFLTALALVFGWLVIVQAANNDFTADGDVTVELTGGNVTVLSGSTAESVVITDGVLTVSNPGSTSTPLFKLQPAGGGTVSIKATTSAGADAGCSTLTLTLPTAPDTYTVVPQAGQCSGGGGASGGGGGTTTTVTTPTTATTTTSSTTVTATPGSDIGSLDSGSKNVLTSLDTQFNFTTSLSQDSDNSHSAKVSSLDTVNKKIQIILESTPVTIDLVLGEIKKVDLDGDGVNDLSVKFNNLVGETVDLIITNIVSLEKAGLAVGDLIKTAKDSAVYYIDANGRRNLFVNSVTFWTWYSGSWSDLTYKGAKKTLKVISQADFDGLTLGVHVTVNPGVKLIKFQNSPRVYTVSLGKILQEVVKSSGDDAVAKALYSAKYKDKLITIQNGFESDYTKGEALTTTSAVPTGTEELEEVVD
ncbi:MAG: hypothetical protein A3B89_00545 [Candidatus Buchananbacteria bacterium RIFCSPHIGHO2_02_FULL_40_13]|uniref:LysM domain-containing protein n=1 Tax=Candidatus Buchananbacteria bacterium RIFCSPLOWO2_01_FULL_39_33 TaxID=1797543 RepID=A0A1G1YGM0_9BACT|nr:MAG: hypothetical protein A3B89_00545 [Candidatus Buchananbacteria bacterium RIFCSPHIGHO2_02_FULL_40_13]OGY51394.1 MAG: hypothetical protein A3A02_00530 [Candidatus Buchananbacteria bacterium RIFCSPLOWO2_01_FULL_39_33]